MSIPLIRLQDVQGDLQNRLLRPPFAVQVDRDELVRAADSLDSGCFGVEDALIVVAELSDSGVIALLDPTTDADIQRRSKARMVPGQENAQAGRKLLGELLSAGAKSAKLAQNTMDGRVAGAENGDIFSIAARPAGTRFMTSTFTRVMVVTNPQGKLKTLVVQTVRDGWRQKDEEHSGDRVPASLSNEYEPEIARAMRQVWEFISEQAKKLRQRD